jgi:hypothetical protein
VNPAAAAILEGMPGPRDLRRAEHDGMTYICAGSALLACYPSGDAGMRNVAVAVLRQLGFGGRTVAAVMGLTENYVATLHNRALREGTPGLVRERGRPGKLAARDWEQAARWRAEGVSGSQIARRLPVAQSTVSRRLGPAAVQEQLPGARPGGEPAATGRRAEAGPQPEQEPAGPQPEGEPGPQPGAPATPGPEPPPAGELIPAGGSRRRAPGWPGSPTACCPAGMRGRCWPTPTSAGSARRQSWRPRCRPPWPGAPREN